VLHANLQPICRNIADETCVVLAGILFQLGTMTIFVILATDFIVRVTSSRPYQRKLRSSSNTSPVPPPTNPASTSPDASEPITEAKFHENTGRFSLKRVKLLLLTVAFSSLMIYIRGIYRSIELAQGWRGHVIQHEVYFVWLDGFMMVLCLAGFVIGWVGWLLPTRQGWKNA